MRLSHLSFINDYWCLVVTFPINRVLPDIATTFALDDFECQPTLLSNDFLSQFVWLLSFINGIIYLMICRNYTTCNGFDIYLMLLFVVCIHGSQFGFLCLFNVSSLLVYRPCYYHCRNLGKWTVK